MTFSRFPRELDSLPFVLGGKSKVNAALLNYMASALKSQQDAIGVDPLTSTVYTLRSTLVEQFKSFFKIECGEVERELRDDAYIKATTSSETGFCGIITGRYDGKENTPASGYDDLTINLQVNFDNPEAFSIIQSEYEAGTKNLIILANLIAVLPNQETADLTSYSSRFEPYNWPSNYGHCLSPRFNVAGTLVGFYYYFHISGHCSHNANVSPASSPAVPSEYDETFKKGDKFKIRYMAMEIDWL